MDKLWNCGIVINMISLKLLTDIYQRVECFNTINIKKEYQSNFAFHIAYCFFMFLSFPLSLDISFRYFPPSPFIQPPFRLALFTIRMDIINFLLTNVLEIKIRVK